jgi:riboflavin kinase/FMN adenylyltransferase
VESHLFGFDKTVTGGRMELRFLRRIRDEQKFSGVDALRAQISADIETSRKFFAERDVAHSSPQK